MHMYPPWICLYVHSSLKVLETKNISWFEAACGTWNVSTCNAQDAAGMKSSSSSSAGLAMALTQSRNWSWSKSQVFSLKPHPLQSLSLHIHRHHKCRDTRICGRPNCLISMPQSWARGLPLDFSRASSKSRCSPVVYIVVLAWILYG